MYFEISKGLYHVKVLSITQSSFLRRHVRSKFDFVLSVFGGRTSNCLVCPSQHNSLGWEGDHFWESYNEVVVSTDRDNMISLAKIKSSLESVKKSNAELFSQVQDISQRLSALESEGTNFWSPLAN